MDESLTFHVACKRLRVIQEVGGGVHLLTFLLDPGEQIERFNLSAHIIDATNAFGPFKLGIYATGSPPADATEAQLGLPILPTDYVPFTGPNNGAGYPCVNLDQRIMFQANRAIRYLSFVFDVQTEEPESSQSITALVSITRQFTAK